MPSLLLTPPTSPTRPRSRVCALQWLAEMAISGQLNVTSFDIMHLSARSYASMVQSNAALHSFVWHSLARVPLDQFTARAVELCGIGDAVVNDCLHGVGHGGLLNVLFASADGAKLSRCYSACSPPRLFTRFKMRSEHLRGAMALCADVAAAVRRPWKECHSGAYHLAVYYQMPSDLAGVAWLCEVTPPADTYAGGRLEDGVFPGIPPADTCWEQVPPRMD